ncbi:MAG: hypothetical protein EXS32_06030 [Opitutus sp.]|nr:hypothetical protein [Opitutus sp.]
MSNPNPPAPLTTTPRWLVWLGLGALAIYAVFLALNTTVAAGGSDSSGYLNSARLLAAGQWQTELRTPPEFGPQAKLNRLQFIAQGFYVYEGNPWLAPTYPTGLPLHLALAGKFLGWRAGPLVVGLAAALGAIWLCYAVARELGLDPRLAAAGALALGAFPVFVFASIQPLSDTLATAWCLAAVLAALRARRHVGWSAACGGACAMAVLVRPTNVVILPALVVLLGFDWRRLGLAVLCGLPGVAWLALYNHALYGRALASGYGDWQAAFATHYGAPTALHFAKWLAAFLPSVLVALPLAALCHRDTRTRALLALALWFGAIAGLYSFYEFSHEVWWGLRFILPAVPPLILAGLLGSEALARAFTPAHQSRFRATAALVLALWAAGSSWYWTRHLGVYYTKGYEEVYASACAATRTQFPADTLVVCSHASGAIYFYTGCSVLRWDFVTAAEFARFTALAQKAGRSIGAVLFTDEEQPALRERCPGEWSQVAKIQGVTLWRLGAPPPAGGAK